MHLHRSLWSPGALRNQLQCIENKAIVNIEQYVPKTVYGYTNKPLHKTYQEG